MFGVVVRGPRVHSMHMYRADRGGKVQGNGVLLFQGAAAAGNSTGLCTVSKSGAPHICGSTGQLMHVVKFGGEGCPWRGCEGPLSLKHDLAQTSGPCRPLQPTWRQVFQGSCSRRHVRTVHGEEGYACIVSMC